LRRSRSGPILSYMAEQDFPRRYVNRDEARREYGVLADEYARHLTLADPLADAAVDSLSSMPRADAMRLMQVALARGVGAVEDPPEALVRFFESVDTIPAWADFEQMRLGAQTFQRIGNAGLLILSAWSLMNGYHSGAAVKALAFTKQLRERAPRRLAETSRFVTEVTQLDGMRRHASGFQITVHVRLMHAFVRRGVERSGTWDHEAWGAPINQADMLGTVIEFSLLVLEGARQMGFEFEPEEAEALVHLWSYVGYVSGVDEALLAHLTPEPDGVRYAHLVKLVQPGPDEDSRALAEALRTVPLQTAKSLFERQLAPFIVRYHDGLVRAFNGDAIADDLRIPDTPWKHAIHPTRAFVRTLERIRRRVPYANRAATFVGNRMIRAEVRRMLGGREPSFRAH